MVIRAHFDGKTLVLDEPVDLPVNEPLEFEFKPREPAWDPQRAKAALRRLVSMAVDANIPLEALRRENMYEDRGA